MANMVSVAEKQVKQRYPELLERTAQPGRELKRCDALILEARLRQSLVAVRSLGSRGLRVAALETYRAVPTFSSRWCAQAFVCPTDGRAETYLAALDDVIERANPRVLISSSDANVELLRQHRPQLEKRVALAMAHDGALDIALHKERTLNVARQLGLHIPRAITIKRADEVMAALREIGLPAVIKPATSWVWGEQQGVGLTSKLVATAEEARHAVMEMLGHGATVLWQQFLSGRREAIHLFYADGQFYARFAQWAKRTVPPLGGTSVVRQSIALPQDISEQAERLVRAIDLEGYCEVEFRRDSAGVPYLMEINPRLSASVELAVRAGIDFPYLMYRWALGERIPVLEGYRTGLWMRYLRGDLATTVAACLQAGRPGVPSRLRSLFEFAASFVKPMHYDYLDWHDPAPAFASFANFVHYAATFCNRFRKVEHGRQRDERR